MSVIELQFELYTQIYDTMLLGKNQHFKIICLCMIDVGNLSFIFYNTAHLSGIVKYRCNMEPVLTVKSGGSSGLQ